MKLKKRKGFVEIIIIGVLLVVILLVTVGAGAMVGSRQGANANGKMITANSATGSGGSGTTASDSSDSSPVVVPSGPCGQKIVQIASNEVTAREVPKGSNQGPRNSPSNHGITQDYKHGNCYGCSWCSFFATWVLRNAGDSVPIIGQASGVYQYYNRKGQAFTKESVLAGKNTPQPGDIFVKNLTGSGHIGIVVSYSNGIMNSIEGNWGDKVSRNHQAVSASNSEVKGFARPTCQ